MSFALDDDTIHDKLNEVVEGAEVANGSADVLELLPDTDDCNYTTLNDKAAIKKALAPVVKRIKGKLKTAFETAVDSATLVYARVSDGKSKACNRNAYRIVTKAGNLFKIDSNNTSKNPKDSLGIVKMLKDDKNCSYKTIIGTDNVLKYFQSSTMKDVLGQTNTLNQLKALNKAGALKASWGRVLGEKAESEYCPRYFYRFVTTSGYVLALDYDIGD